MIPQDNVFTLAKKAVHTTSHPECPYYTTKEVLEQKHFSDYTPQIQHIINVVTSGEELDPVGSSKYLVHKYPSDIDMFEPIEDCCSINTVRFSAAQKIQSIVKRIKAEPGMFFSRFQCGYDRRYDIYFGDYNDYSAVVAKRSLENLYEQGLLTKSERDYGLSLAVSNPSRRQFSSLYWLLREKMIVDWTLEEIESGVKLLPQKKKLYLDEALIDKSLVKLDVWAQIEYPDYRGQRYVEVTNWFLIEAKNIKGEVEVLSIVQQDRIASLKADIFKYIESDPLKAAKRYWNYLFELNKTKEVEQQLTKLAPLFSSYIAFLNSVLTDLELQKRMLKLGLITEGQYKQFIKDTRTRMTTVAPDCFKSSNNKELAAKLNENEMSFEIQRLTKKYLEIKKINILNFIENH